MERQVQDRDGDEPVPRTPAWRHANKARQDLQGPLVSGGSANLLSASQPPSWPRCYGFAFRCRPPVHWAGWETSMRTAAIACIRAIHGTGLPARLSGATLTRNIGYVLARDGDIARQLDDRTGRLFRWWMARQEQIAWDDKE